jgi:hypothetical protein
LCVCVGGFESSLKALSLFSFGIWKSTMLLVLPLPKRIYNIHIILFCLESQVQSGKYFQFGDGSLLDPSFWQLNIFNFLPFPWHLLFLWSVFGVLELYSKSEGC